MNPQRQRPLPPVFSSTQEQNKAECAAIWYTYAGEAEQQNDLLGARMGFMCAWKEQPEELRYFQTVVNFLHRNEFIEELFSVYQIGSQLFASHVPTLVNYSNLLNEYGEHQKAKEITEKVLMLQSHCLPAWGNLGNAFRGLGEFTKSASCFEKILKDDPENAVAGFNLASVFLSVGEYERGFYYYDMRLNLPGCERLQSRNSSPFWDEEYLDGKSILVYAEQGLGDTLMFARYLQLLVDFGAKKIFFEVQKPIKWALESLNSESIVVVERQSLDEPFEIDTDYQIPLLSLPHIALMKRATLDTNVPYLEYPECDAPRALEKIIGIQELKQFRVGLCWQGNPNASIDCGRSIDLQHLRPLLTVSNVDFVSLQGRDGLDSIDSVASDFENFHHLDTLDGESRAFEETLTLMNGLDIVITTDTAIAHLAGALGKRCWVLLKKYPEWRWGIDKVDTHWYPNMTLFRQDESGNWNLLIENVKTELEREIITT